MKSTTKILIVCLICVLCLSVLSGCALVDSLFGAKYDVEHVCDIIHSTGADILGTYEQDFYKGMPAVTENNYGKGKAYYVAFRNDEDFSFDFCNTLMNEIDISSDTALEAESGVIIRKRGNVIFAMNFTDSDKVICLDQGYTDILSDEKISGKITVASCGYRVLR